MVKFPEYLLYLITSPADGLLDPASYLSVRAKLLHSHVQLFATPWAVAHQAILSMEFSRSEFWSGLPFPSSGDLSDPGIEPKSPALQGDSLPSEPLNNLIEDRYSVNAICYLLI